MPSNERHKAFYIFVIAGVINANHVAFAGLFAGENTIWQPKKKQWGPPELVEGSNDY